jgi:hypothetical protein
MIHLLFTLLLLIPLTGCAGHMTISHEVQLKSSQSIFLAPSKNKTLYVQTRNTSDNPGVTFPALTSRLTQKGYMVVDDPDSAQYLLQTQVVLCNKLKPGQTIDGIIAGGFGGALGSAIGTASALSGGSYSYIPMLGVVGAVAGFAGSKLTEDTVYGCATDVMITERTKEVVEQTLSTQSAQGNAVPQQLPAILGLLGGPSLPTPDAGQTTQHVTETRKGNQRLHQTRIVASDQKMWLSIEEATNLLSQRLEDAIAGLF